MDCMVYLVTERSLQTSVLEERLKSAFHMSIVPPVELLTNPSLLNDKVALLDLAVMPGKEIECLLLLIHDKCLNARLALFNTDRSQNIQTLLKYRNIRGIFYTDDSLELLDKGIRALCNGEYWLSRKMMTSMLEYMQVQQDGLKNTQWDYIQKEMLAGDEDLTKREKEILQLVSTGATNTELAIKLFLSENTVKTHLSNLYRKLGIRNRTQATAWVKRHEGYLG